MTSRKDYEIVADVMRERYRKVQAAPARLDGSLALLDGIVADLSSAFEDDNPRFNRRRFMTACLP